MNMRYTACTESEQFNISTPYLLPVRKVYKIITLWNFDQFLSGLAQTSH